MGSFLSRYLKASSAGDYRRTSIDVAPKVFDDDQRGWDDSVYSSPVQRKVDVGSPVVVSAITD